MPKAIRDPTILDPNASASKYLDKVRNQEVLIKAGALQSAIFNSANFSSIATDAKGVIQIFNVGAERMLGYAAADVMNKITPADISDPQEVIARAKALSTELGTPITPGFEALVFKASRGIEDIYELTYIRKDGTRFPAVVSVTALRDAQDAIIGYLLIGTDNTARKQAEEALLKAGALQSAIFNSANFSSIATDAKGVIQIFNVGAERMLGFKADDVMNKITPADISDPQEVIARAKALSLELGTTITPGFEALVFKASRGIEDIYELTYIRKDGTRFPAVVSVTALRDAQDAIIGYLLIGTDNTARKSAEEALLKAGALQSAIFNSANFSSIATDAKGVIQIFNVGAERMLGYKADDVMNKITPADISDPQEVIARAEALSAELDTEIAPGFEALVFKASRGIEDIYELTYIRKDGSRFTAVVSVTALRDAENAIIGYLLIGTDNTARKQIEAEQEQLGQRLRDNQFYTRTLFESNIDALMTTNPSGIITDVNKQMEILTGSTRDELIGAPFKNNFADPERAEAGIKLALAKRKVTNYELTARDRDGKETVVSYNATTFYDRERRLQGVFAAARDITERKQAAEALKAREERFRILFNRASDGILIVSPGGRPVSVNEAFARMHGYSVDEVLNMELNGLYTPEAQERISERMQRILSGESTTFEVEHYHKNGHVVSLEVSSSLIVSDGERLIQSFHRDITERKQAETQRTQLESQLRESQKMEALGTLAGGVAHDFNNALAAILGNVELARQDVGAGHAALVSLEEIDKASRRAKDLVQQILAFGRRQKLERKATSLALVVVESARLVRATLPAMVSLRVECEADTPAVLADASQIKQILLNLCSNALQAVQGQGRPSEIKVRLYAVVLAQGEARGDLLPGRYACLTVGDNGTGMDELTRSHIFEPFFTTKSSGKGTGLGLSVVHGIVQAHEAYLEVESTLGTGSEFHIYFPALETPVSDIIEPTAHNAPIHGKGKHVLYVDDEEAIIFLMTRLLERQGYRVSGFTDPHEALAVVRANPDQFDLAVTDYNMPGMSGLEVASALREIRADLPVVLASGYITEELRARAPAAGVRELIYKPNTVDDLCEAVARCANAQTVDGTLEPT